MWVMGVLIVMGSGLGFIGGAFFPFDNWAGVSASVAGVAFGAGIMIAGFDPIANVSWVRALIIYAILEIVWQIFSVISDGKFDIIPLIISILVRGSRRCPFFFYRPARRGGRREAPGGGTRACI
jgi:hypothetical protein